MEPSVELFTDSQCNQPFNGRVMLTPTGSNTIRLYAKNSGGDLWHPNIVFRDSLGHSLSNLKLVEDPPFKLAKDEVMKIGFEWFLEKEDDIGWALTRGRVTQLQEPFEVYMTVVGAYED